MISNHGKEGQNLMWIKMDLRVSNKAEARRKGNLQPQA